MEQPVQQLNELIKASDRILVTSHISPDPDAVSSVILMGLTLKLNFPEKNIKMVLEEKPEELSFISSFDEIVFKPVLEALQDFNPSLFILLDGNNYERSSRNNGQDIRGFITKNSVKTAVIDHHELDGRDQTDVFINNDSPATVQDVYEICFESFKLRKPDGAAQIAMTGFYADSGGFVYVKAGGQAKLFNFAEKLVSVGANIEEVKNQLERYSEDDMRVLSELTANTAHSQEYNFSFLSDEFVDKWAEKGKNHLQLQRPTNTFLNNYIRNIDGRTWGFIVYRNLAQGNNIYSASFRSQGGDPDVALFARELGGGGHKPAAGAKFEAASLEDALHKVQATISALAQS